MLIRIIDAPTIESSVYNTPAEIWEVAALRRLVEEILAWPVELTSDADGGPICDGRRFVRDFEFQLNGVRDYLLGIAGSSRSPIVCSVPCEE